METVWLNCDQKELLARLSLEHLEKYSYTNIQIFSQGFENPEFRKTPELHFHPPTYCLQHNECIYRQLISYGCVNIKRISAVVVNRFEGDADEESLSQDVIAHDVLFVDDKYFIDVGFAANSLRGALEFRGTEEEVTLQGDIYKFKPAIGFSHHTLNDTDWWGVFVQVGSKWLELWRFPVGVELDERGLLDLNESLIHSPSRVNIRDTFYLVARVTASTRVCIRASKGEEKPILKILETPSAISPAGKSTSLELDTWSALITALREHCNQSPPPDLIRQCFYVEMEKVEIS